MEIYTLEDVDKFFDKFQDPSHETELIRKQLNHLYALGPHTPYNQARGEEVWALREYFIKKLIMKSYRLGKEHAYADSVSVIRSSNLIK